MENLEEAVEKVLNGDSTAFGQIVEATSPRLVRMSARMLGSIQDAEDVVQDSYVKAYRSLQNGQFDRRAKVETWLYRIVVNTTLDAKRSKARSKTTASDQLEHTGGWESVAATEARVALREMSAWLDRLPEEQRTVLWLKTIEGLESAEVAAILGCSEGAVEQRLVRARATLREKRSDAR